MLLDARVLPIALLVLATAGAAHAEVYRWTDAAGRMHFTDSLDQVPASQREAARRASQAPAAGADRVQRYTGSAASELPARTARPRRDEIEIRFARMGSLMRVEATVNDLVSVPFLVDTGASGVSIPRAYAEKLGLRIRPDTPHVEVMTANGVVSRPIVPLRSVELDGARVENLMAVVDPGLEFGLLGGSFFNNYVYRVDAARSVITLSRNEDLRGGLGEDQWREQFRAWIDPLQRLENHLRDHPQISSADRAAMVVRRQRLEQGLQELESQADALGVPHSWRD